MKPAPTRRRFLAIAAATGGLALLPPWATSASGADLHIWRGTALGADACLQLHHPDPTEADRLIRLCLNEVARLEQVFSLYRADSALVRLNRMGSLDNPPTDLVRLLTEAQYFSRLTEGAFDVTVQPLWQLYAEHFSRPGAELAGPPLAAVEAVRSLVDSQALRVDHDRVSFARRGMAITLNGIAQGYITDRVGDRLRTEGMTNVLVDMGEVLALGRHPEGRSWRIGSLNDGNNPKKAIIEAIDIAVATSSSLGTQFDPAGRFGHIFDPLTGNCAAHPISVTVTALDATTADIASTALAATSWENEPTWTQSIPGITIRIDPVDEDTSSDG